MFTLDSRINRSTLRAVHSFLFCLDLDSAGTLGRPITVGHTVRWKFKQYLYIAVDIQGHKLSYLWKISLIYNSMYPCVRCYTICSVSLNLVLYFEIMESVVSIRICYILRKLGRLQFSIQGHVNSK